jgi:hypothetical protein
MSRRFRDTVHMIAAIAILSSCSSALFGQGRYTVGVSADATGGGKSPDFAGSSISQNSQNYAAFLATYPSLKLTARGEHSSLETSYGFGYEKSYFDPSYETKSHSATVAYSTNLGPRWKFKLADMFSMTNDISSYRLLSGATSDAEQFQFAFTPVFARSNRSNNANAAFDRILSKQSSLSVSGSYSTLDYPGGSVTSGVLSDQKRIALAATYTHSGQHYTWSLGYSGARFNFSSFQNSFNHSALAGYSYQFSQALSLRIDVGPSYLDSLDNVKSPVGVNVTVNLKRTVQKGSFGLTVSQTSGDTSGLGSVSTFREAGLNLNRALSRSVSISADASAFDTQGLQINSVSARGIRGGGSIGYTLGRDWSLNWGGQYQHYEGYTTSGYDQKRLFMSLRYSKPALWRF